MWLRHDHKAGGPLYPSTTLCKHRDRSSAPGVISTDMTSGVKEKYDTLIEKGLCVTPRWGYPEDVGRVVGALASGKFPYSTGQVIMVDGGLTIPRL